MASFQTIGIGNLKNVDLTWNAKGVLWCNPGRKGVIESVVPTSEGLAFTDPKKTQIGIL